MYLAKLDMQGRTVVVAGGGAGMGFAIAQALTEAGARVAVVDIDKSRAEAAAAKLGSDRTLALAADVCDTRQVDTLVADVTKRWGGFDALATVVGGMEGIAPWAPLRDTVPADWNKVVHLNLGHFFLLARAAVNHFIQRRVAGSIVSVSSVNGLLSAPNHAAYGAAKAGMISVTRTLAAECGQHGIRVNSIAPGAIMTERSAEAYTPKAVERLSGVIPLGRLGRTEDVASVALFLLSDLASYITGQTIVVDGGAMDVYPFGLQKAED